MTCRLLVCLLLTKCFFFCANIQQHTLTNNRILFPGEKLWEKFSERKSGLKLQSNHYPSSLVKLIQSRTLTHPLCPEVVHTLHWTNHYQQHQQPQLATPTTKPCDLRVEWDKQTLTRHYVFLLWKKYKLSVTLGRVVMRAVRSASCGVRKSFRRMIKMAITA